MPQPLTLDQWKTRALAAEEVVRHALWMTPFTHPPVETVDEYRTRLHTHVDASHPEQRIRYQHQPMEVYKLADSPCGCDPDSEDYEGDHGERDPDSDEYLCMRSHLGWICQTCESEDLDGPEWKPSAVQWPCPPVAAINQAASVIELFGIARRVLGADAEASR